MKKTTSTGARRVSVAQAKSQLSALLRTIDRQPVVIHNRGRDVAKLTGAGAHPEQEPGDLPFVRFFQRLEALRRRLGIKGVNFNPARAVIHPADPFAGE